MTIRFYRESQTNKNIKDPTKEYTEMANKYKKRCSLSLMKYIWTNHHFTTNVMAANKQKLTITNVKNTEQWPFSHIF